MIKIHLSRILGEKRITQAEIARKTGIRPNTLSEIYNELVDRVNLNHLDLLCDLLECEIKDIIEHVPNSLSQTRAGTK